MSIFESTHSDSTDHASTTDQSKLKRATKQRRNYGKNVTDATVRFAASRQIKNEHESGKSGISEEKRRAIIDMFKQMEEESGRTEIKRKIDHATRKMISLWTLIEDEIASVREAVGIPEFGSRDPV